MCNSHQSFKKPTFAQSFSAVFAECVYLDIRESGQTSGKGIRIYEKKREGKKEEQLNKTII